MIRVPPFEGTGGSRSGGARRRPHERNCKINISYTHIPSLALRRERRRPKRRSTRRARMTRAMPVGSLVRTRETSDMPTTNMSSQHQGSETKARNQEEKATTTSSAVKTMVKKRLAWSRAAPKLVKEPSGLTRSLPYCDSRMVQMKLCARPCEGRAAAFESENCGGYSLR